MDWRADLLPAALLGGAFLLLLAAAEVWTRRGRPQPERPRKLVHLLGGLICLAFPWFLTSPWTVAALGAGLTAAFLIGRKHGLLECLYGVERKSLGVEYYPGMVFTLFWLAHERPWLYAASLLSLAVADALAALVGKHWGRWRYEVDDENRSVEGSLTFFLAALCAMGAPLLLSDEPELPSRIQRLPIAAVAAVLVTLFEAVSRHGRDNLWVPLGTYLVLTQLTAAPVVESYYQLASLLAVCAGVTLLGALSRAVNVGAALTLILVIYGSWALASFDWAIPLISAAVVSMLASYRFPLQQPLRARGMAFKALPMVIAAAAANLAAIAGNTRLYQTLFAASVGGCLVVLVQNLWHGVIRLRRDKEQSTALWLAGVAVVATAALSLPLWPRNVNMTLAFTVVLLMVAVLNCLAHDLLFAGFAPHTQQSTFVWRRQMAVLVAMLVCALATLSPLVSALTPR